MLVAGGAMAGQEAGGDDGAAAAGIVSALLMGVMFLVIMIGGFVLGLIMQVGILRAEISDDINVSLRFKETIAMTRMLTKELIIGGIVMYLLAMATMFFGVLTLYLGLIPGFVVYGIISTYYRAELYKVYLQKGGQPLPMGSLNVEGGDPALVHPHGAPAHGQQPGAFGQPGQQPPQQGGGGWGPPPAQF